MLRGQLLGLLRLPAVVAGSALLLVLALLVAVALRGVTKLAPVVEHQAYLRLLQDVMISSQQVILDSETQARPDLNWHFLRFREQIDELLALEQPREAQTRDRIRAIQHILANEAQPVRSRLTDALFALRPVLADEQEAHRRLLQSVERTARIELGLAVLLVVVLPMAGLGAGYLLRHRVWKPLGNLAALLNELSVQDYRQIPETAVAEASPIVTPVYRNYNALVGRLQTLEAEHQRREDTLEQEVREATAALLDLNRQLAASERLAAVGAISAGLAHELRNPLAGIRMACTRLRDALQDPSQAERLDIVVNELDRLTQLLNSQLAQVHHAPEPASEVALEECIDGLLSLVRYQVPEQLRIEANIDGPLPCTLPVGQLRQALWNLVLNAAQAIGDEPGSIAISARLSEGCVVLSVEDDGPGFSLEELSAPARAFVSAREGGTGLGLATVHRFARELGGTVALQNRTPRGACVTLTLPCKIGHE